MMYRCPVYSGSVSISVVLFPDKMFGLSVEPLSLLPTTDTLLSSPELAMSSQLLLFTSYSNFGF
jgi:hypothetical protein